MSEYDKAMERMTGIEKDMLDNTDRIILTKMEEHIQWLSTRIESLQKSDDDWQSIRNLAPEHYQTEIHQLGSLELRKARAQRAKAIYDQDVIVRALHDRQPEQPDEFIKLF